MGLKDHKRTWHYTVSATPNACIDAFVAAFSGKGGLLKGAKWNVTKTSNGARAVYEGRKGLAAAAAIMSKTSAQESETAVGSTVEFSIDSTQGGVTRCSMALTRWGNSGVAGVMGATSDARFIKPYMRSVADQIKAIDAAAVIESA